MRADEFRRRLAEIASEPVVPAADAATIVQRGNRRRRRRALAGVVVLAIVAVGGDLVASARHGRSVVVSPSPTTEVRPQPPVGAAATSIIFTSASEGWVCADPLLHTADGGRTWQAQSYARLAAGTHTCAAVPTDAWIVVQSPGGRVTILPAQGGANIAVTIGFPSLPVGAVIAQTTFIDRTHGWVLAAAAHGTTGQGLLYRTTTGTGPVDFALVSSAAPVGGVQFANPNDGWGTDGSTLQRTTDAGATWRAVKVPTPPPVARELGVHLDRVVVHGSTIVVAGDNPSGGFSRAFFLASTDAGGTWTERNGPPAGFGTTEPRMFEAVDGDHWRLAFGTQMWITDDGGLTWEARALPANVVSIAFPTPDIGWATDVESHVMQTTDAARTWHPVDSTPQPPWYSRLAAVPNECPTDAVTEPPGNIDRIAAATNAALDFVLRTRGWTGEQVGAAYPVTKPGGQYGVVFSSNVPKECGAAVADASYGVELFNSSVTQDSSRSTALVVAHFADGWRVWGFYR